MRRKEKEITDRRSIDRILEKAQFIHLAMCDQGMPYVVPLNFGYDGESIYVHCALEGKKVEIVRKNNRVYFAVETDVEVIPSQSPCKFTCNYRSVMGEGKALIIEEPAEKKKGLEILVGHYANEEFQFPDMAMDKVLVIKIEIEGLWGKESIKPKPSSKV